MDDSPTGPLPRTLTPALLGALRRFPVVVLTGARQTGKTTLVTSPPIGEGRAFRTLDDFDVLDRARREPDAVLDDGPRLTLDEVQRAPELLLAIKRAVDRARKAGRFLLTGSANLLMMRTVSESLAGRAVYLNLWPMTEAEKGGRPSPGPWSGLLSAASPAEAREVAGPSGRALADWPQRAWIGGYPVPALAADAEERVAWFDGYVRTYLERDLQDVASISALSDFRRLMRIAALRIGQVVNQSELARDAGLPQATAHRYLNLLETSYQMVRIPSYAVNRTKRIVKSPKLYWTDTGLACHLCGLHDPAAVKDSPQSGALVENLLLTQLLSWRETVSPRPEIHYWRTHRGDEVDFVLEHGRRVLPIEVKLTKRPTIDDGKPLSLFLEDHARAAPYGILLHGGTETFSLTGRILAVPLGAVFGG